MNKETSGMGEWEAWMGWGIAEVGWMNGRLNEYN